MIMSTIHMNILSLIFVMVALLRSESYTISNATPQLQSIRTLRKNGFSRTILNMAVETNEDSKSDLSPWLSLNTRGGAIVWSTILLVVPIGAYYTLLGNGIEESRAGSYVGSSFVLLSMLAWASTYIFRVANKDMTYAKQLRDYENAVLQKRLDELADDEIQALMEEIDVEEEKSLSAKSLK